MALDDVTSSPPTGDPTPTPVRDEEFQLFDVASEVARRCSDGMLASLAAAGIAGLAAAGILGLIRLVPPALVVLGFGAWGIFDREADGGARRAIRPVAGTLAVVGGIGTLIEVLFAALGTIIS